MSEKPISPLRRRMLDDMTMRRFTPDTQRDYIRRDDADDCGRSQTPGGEDRDHRGAAHLGLGDDPEPSLKIPGIIISLIFSEQRKLVFRATLGEGDHDISLRARGNHR